MSEVKLDSNRDALKVVSLLERIGHLVTSYEGTIAEIRTDATLQIQELNLKISELTKKINELEYSVTKPATNNSVSEALY